MERFSKSVAWMTAHRRYVVVAFLASCLMVLLSSVALHVYSSGLNDIYVLRNLPHRTACFVLTMALCALLLFVVLVSVARALPSVVNSIRATDCAMSISFSKKSVLLGGLFVLACWIPWILLQYPAATTYDTYNQLYQYATSAPTLYTTTGQYLDAEYVSHHPVAVTLLFGAFYSIGNALGSYNAGLFLYAFTQCLLTALSLSAVCCYAVRLGLPKKIAFALLFACALFPVFPQWAAYMGKDSLYSLAFLPYMLCFVEIIRSKGAFLGQKRHVAYFVVLSLLCMLFKKPGLYIVAASNLFLLVYCWRYCLRWQSIVQFFLPLLISVVLIPVFVYPLLGGVAKDGTQESIGVLMQQVVTVIVEDDDITAEERESLEAVFDVDKATSKYSPVITDPVKNTFKQDSSSQDVVNFIWTWFKIGLRHPIEYGKSSLRIASGLLGPSLPMNYYASVTNYETDAVKNSELGNTGFQGDFSKPSSLAAADSDALSAWKQLASIPLLGVFLSRGFYGGWLPLICALLVGLYRKRYLVCFIPIALSVLVSFICPVADARYILPLVYCAPLMTILVLHSADGFVGRAGRHASS